MKIAIDTADLDCERIDGTRVYIQNVLKYLGKLASEDEFFVPSWVCIQLFGVLIFLLIKFP